MILRMQKQTNKTGVLRRQHLFFALKSMNYEMINKKYAYITILLRNFIDLMIKLRILWNIKIFLSFSEECYENSLTETKYRFILMIINVYHNINDIEGRQ